jgi:putative ABC transport system permease protein
VPRISGRTIETRDGAEAPRIAVLSATAAARLWPGESPLGKRFRFNQEESAPWVTVVGVVGDVRDRIDDSGPRPAVWVPFEQDALAHMYLVLRTARDPLSVARAAQQAVYAVDPLQPVTALRTLEMVLSERLSGMRIGTWMMGAFALLALLLAVVGIYGVVATLVAQRTHEIGVRMALGAQRGDVVRLVLRRGVVLTAVGVVIGLGAGVALVRFLASVLGAAVVNDLTVFVIFTSVVAGIATAGSLVPAWRATKVDPLLALRGE